MKNHNISLSRYRIGRQISWQESACNIWPVFQQFLCLVQAIGFFHAPGYKNRTPWLTLIIRSSIPAVFCIISISRIRFLTIQIFQRFLFHISNLFSGNKNQLINCLTHFFRRFYVNSTDILFSLINGNRCCFSQTNSFYRS